MRGPKGQEEERKAVFFSGLVCVVVCAPCVCVVVVCLFCFSLSLSLSLSPPSGSDLMTTLDHCPVLLGMVIPTLRPDRLPGRGVVVYVVALGEGVEVSYGGPVATDYRPDLRGRHVQVDGYVAAHHVAHGSAVPGWEGAPRRGRSGGGALGEVRGRTG